MRSGHAPILYLVHHGDVKQTDLSDGFSFGVPSFRRRCDLDLSGYTHTPVFSVFRQDGTDWILQNYGSPLQVDSIILSENMQCHIPGKAVIRILKSRDVPESVFLIFDSSKNPSGRWERVDKNDPRYPEYSDQIPSEENCAWINGCLCIRTGGKIICQEKALRASAENDLSAYSKSDPGLFIDIREVTAGGPFHKTTILKDVRVSMLPGEMVMLLGGSGSGKSTFMEAASGLVPADATVRFCGHDLLCDGQERKLFCIVPQSPETQYRQTDTVYHTLDDAAILYAPEEIAGSALRRRKRIMELLAMMDLTDVRSSRCSSLSGGQRKKLGILLEYIAEPKIMFLDEPDSGIDGTKVTDIMQHLRSIADEGKILCIITHTPDRIRDYFDKVAVIAKGSGGYGTLAYYGTIPDAMKFFESKSLEDVVGEVSGQPQNADAWISKFEKLREIKNDAEYHTD